jgi:hypothetical protein
MPGVDDQEKKKPEDQPGAEDKDKGKQDDKKADEKKEVSEDDGDSGQVDLEKLDPKVQKLIKDLRTESASHRTKNKNLDSQLSKLKKGLVEAGVIEDDSEEPEEKIKSLSSKTAALEVNIAILSAAVEYGIQKDALEYFEFLVNKKLESLGEGEELTDELLDEIAQSAKKTVKGNAKSTSVGDGKGADGEEKDPPEPGAKDGEVTLEKFVRMNITEKSQLYVKNPELYNRLFSEAKQKKLLVV